MSRGDHASHIPLPVSHEHRKNQYVGGNTGINSVPEAEPVQWQQESPLAANPTEIFKATRTEVREGRSGSFRRGNRPSARRRLRLEAAGLATHVEDEDSDGL
jgi:hypothetical protein